MNRNEFKRRFPRASEDTIRKNCPDDTDPRVSYQSKQLDRERPGETCGSEEMGAQYRLCHCEIEFFANHGRELDQDNRRYIAKPILDALVNLGFSRNDKDITSEATQRFNEADINIHQK